MSEKKTKPQSFAFFDVREKDKSRDFRLLSFSLHFCLFLWRQKDKNIEKKIKLCTFFFFSLLLSFSLTSHKDKGLCFCLFVMSEKKEKSREKREKHRVLSFCHEKIKLYRFTSHMFIPNLVIRPCSNALFQSKLDTKINFRAL